jgi:hypothetical protein
VDRNGPLKLRRLVRTRPSLIIQKMLDDPYDEWVGITVPQERLLFNDGTFFEFDLVVDTDIALVEYSCHFQDGPMASMIWRKDLHDGHERELGTKAHISTSIPADPNDRLPFDVVEVDEVISRFFVTRILVGHREYGPDPRVKRHRVGIR